MIDSHRRFPTPTDKGMIVVPPSEITAGLCNTNELCVAQY